MQESDPSPALDFEALARVLEETVASTPGVPADAALPAGTALRYFGDYLLEEEIARGGMGIVYRAVQLSLDRPVAVKVLRDAAFAGGQEVERFRREASSAAALRHRNIVGIHEIGENDGRHFFSMDYVPGRTLGQVLKDGPLPSRRAAELMVKISGAIEHAHGAGVLHRDLKPSNVIMDAEGEPVVTDFGLAKYDAADLSLTLSGQVLGTPAYMAPEQAEGQSRDAGPHTDVYGLGALLYHLLTGRQPFTADSHAAVLAQVTLSDPVSVRLLNPSVPRDLETVCAKAMAKEPARRYASAQALADDLQRFLDGKPVLARPVSSLEKLWRWARLHRALAASLAAIVLLTLTVLTVVTISRARIDRLRGEAVSRLYASDMRLALQNIAQDKYGAAATLLDRYADPADGEDQRGFEWYLARHLSRSDETTSPEPLAGLVRAVAWSADGRWLAAGGENLRVWEMVSGRPVLRHTAEAPAYALSFSPDGTRLALSMAEGTVAVCESSSPDKTLFTGKFPASPAAIGWQADGKALEVIAPQMHWRWEPGKTDPVRVGPLGGLAHVAYLNAGARRGLSIQAGPAGGDAWQVVVRDTERGLPFATVRTPNDRMPKCMTCSADNRWLVIGDFTGQLALLETPFERRIWRIQAHRSMVDQVAISSDGSLVASAGDHIIHLRGREQGALHRSLRGHRAKVSALTFSPDGAWLLSGDTSGAVKCWSLAAPPADALSVPESGVSPSADGAALSWNVNANQVGFLPAGGGILTFDMNPQGTLRRVFHNGVIFQASGAAGEKDPLTIYSADGPPAEWSVPGKLTGCSPDGRWVSYTDGTSGATMLTDRTSRGPAVPIAGGWIVTAPAFSADSRRCAVADQRGRCRVLDTATGSEVCLISAHRGPVRGKTLSAEGALLGTAGFDGLAKLWDVPSGKLRQEFTGSPDTLWSVALSPDGRRLAAGTGESTVILWDVASGLQTGTVQLDGTPGPVEILTFTPDGAALIAHGRVVGPLNIRR